MFFWNSFFFDDPSDDGNLISGFSVFSKSSWNNWKFMVHILLKPGLENFEDYFASMWDECNCVVVWAFFGIAFLWDWNENWPFSVLWPLLSFPNLLAYWVQTFTASSFKIWNSSMGIPSPPLALLRPAWLRIPGCLALGEWSDHRDYLGHEDLFLYFVFLLLIHLKSLFGNFIFVLPYTL